MAFYRNISINFWTDSKIDDDFTPEDKYFYLYLLTNPHTNICGCYEISMKQMERETGYNEDTIKRLINRMERIHKVIRYDSITKEVLIINWSKYNWSASAKVEKAIAKVADRIKSVKFKNFLLSLINNNISNTDIQYTVTETETETAVDTATATGFMHSVSIPYAYDTDTVSNAPTKKKRFEKPTLEQVQAYCRERKNNVNAERFVDYYESNGWKVGKNAMKDWKAAVRTWERNGYSNDSVNTSDRDIHNIPDEELTPTERIFKHCSYGGD